MRRLKIIGLLALSALPLSGCTHAMKTRLDKHVLNKPAPDFELTAMDGGQTKLSDFRGKPVILSFWSHT